MRDSEPSVKVGDHHQGPFDSDSLNRNSCNHLIMAAKTPTNRDTVLSDFVRYKIQEWLRAGNEQQALAEKAGLRPSAIAMIKAGQGVGAKSAPKIAKALGYSSVEAMVDDAYAWRQGLGESLERRLADPNFQAGVAAASLFMVAPTEAEIRTIAADFVAPRFDKREPQWWSSTIGTELVHDRARALPREEREAKDREFIERANIYRERAGMKKVESRAAAYTATVRGERGASDAGEVVELPVKRKRARGR